MALNARRLAEALPKDTWFTQSELEEWIAQTAKIKPHDNAAKGAAVAILSGEKLILARACTQPNAGQWEWVKNPNPPAELSWQEARQAEIDRRVAQDLDVLKQINDATKMQEEVLHGPARRAEEAQFRARVISLLKELNLVPQDTPVPVVEQVGNRIDYAGPPMPGSFAATGR